MNNSLGQILNKSINSTGNRVPLIKFQSGLLKVLCVLIIALALAYINVKLAISVGIAAICIKGILFIKDLLTINLDFHLDDKDLMEIDEQMWR